MHRRKFLIVPLFVLTLLLVSLLPGAGRAADGLMEIPTKHTYAQLVTRLNAAITAENMFVVARASASIGASRRGVKIPGNMVVGVFRNDFAVRMLNASISAGIEAPIRFYVTENADGTGTLRYYWPSAVFARYDGGTDLMELGAELDRIWEAIANRAVKG